VTKAKQILTLLAVADAWGGYAPEVSYVERLIGSLELELAKLKELGLVSEKDRRLCLKGRETQVEQTERRFQVSQKFWRKARFYFSFLRFFPYLDGIYVYNSLSFDNANERSDIDPFFLVKPGRIWLTRLFVSLFFMFLGQRRYGKRIAGKFCMSFFIATDIFDFRPLTLGGEGDVLYAWLVSNLRPVWGERYLHDIASANSWIKNYFPKYSFETYRFDKVVPMPSWIGFLRGIALFIFEILGAGLWEKVVKDVQLRKIRNNPSPKTKSHIIASDEIIKFHPIDLREKFEKKVKQTLEKYERATAKS